MGATHGSSRRTMSSLIILLANFRPSGAFLDPSQGGKPAHASCDSRQLPPRPLPVSSSALLATSKAGGGGSGAGGDNLPPAGDFSLFDPDAEGKLQGTGSLHERLRLGSNYGSTSSDVSPAMQRAWQELVELAKSNDEKDEKQKGGVGEEVATNSEQIEKVNLGASMLAAEPPVGAVDSSAGVDAGTDMTPPADGIILELDSSGNTGNPIADPTKVQIQQMPIRSITALDDVPARIQFKDTLAPSAPRIIKSLQIQLSGTPDHFQLIFSDPAGDRMKKRIEYQPHLLTAVKRYRIVKTWDLARRRLDQQSGVIGGVGGAVMQAGSFQTTVQSGVVSASSSTSDSTSAAASDDNTTTTIDVQFGEDGWLDSINVDGRTIVTASGYLDSIYEESERFVCYPELYLTGSATVQDMTFHL